METGPSSAAGIIKCPNCDGDIFWITLASLAKCSLVRQQDGSVSTIYHNEIPESTLSEYFCDGCERKWSYCELVQCAESEEKQIADEE